MAENDEFATTKLGRKLWGPRRISLKSYPRGFMVSSKKEVELNLVSHVGNHFSYYGKQVNE